MERDFIKQLLSESIEAKDAGKSEGAFDADIVRDLATDLLEARAQLERTRYRIAERVKAVMVDVRGMTQF